MAKYVVDACNISYIVIAESIGKSLKYTTSMHSPANSMQTDSIKALFTQCPCYIASDEQQNGASNFTICHHSVDTTVR